MQFELNKAGVKSLVAAFRADKLAKGKRKVERHGLERFFGTVEARDGAVEVNSGRVRLRVDATVAEAGTFSVRDAVLRQLLSTMGDESLLRLVAGPAGVTINGSMIGLPADDYIFSSKPQQ
jgi:hypothetical protein